MPSGIEAGQRSACTTPNVFAFWTTALTWYLLVTVIIAVAFYTVVWQTKGKASSACEVARPAFGSILVSRID